MELDQAGKIISQEEFYPYGATAWWMARTKVEASYKTIRYSGKELDATGLYYFGYRYYMPWLGRWLNPDPAGTVDGLNLYRMVRNNPVTLMDPDGNAPIDPSDFNQENGDLFYGLQSKKLEFLEINFNINRFEITKAFTTLDRYTDAVSVFVLEFNSMLLDAVQYDPRSYANQVVVQRAEELKRQVKGYNSAPLWEDFFNIGAKNDKFNVSKIYEEVSKKYGQGFPYTYNEELTPGLLEKRWSKLGIEIAATNKKTKIHFVLDGIDVEKVVKKEGKFGDSYTASELRYTYRNWDRLKNNVIFYRDNEKLETTPWGENPSLWSAYKPSSKACSSTMTPSSSKNLKRKITLTDKLTTVKRP